MHRARYQVIVVGGGHAGVEAAWAAANLLREPHSVALVTLDPTKIGVMSCNPAIGGLAKGQLVREVDALGGLMGLATDATGIQFKTLNTSKGPAVHGPRAQCDKHAYAETVQQFVRARAEIDIIPGAVERLIIERVPGSTQRRIVGVEIRQADQSELRLEAGAVVLTTGTFMRGLMHTGESRTPGGRHGEAAAVGISKALEDLGFELGRLKTGTPPRLRRSSLDWDTLPDEWGDAEPTPFSDLTPALGAFPRLAQVACKRTSTTPEAHEAIRANLHRAPMFTGDIEGVGPRYCPSIEDKVVRFAERESHGVYLEPESLRDEVVYCNGISSSLPRDVQDVVVRTMPGCANAEIVRYGYAVEYDMVRPHQILVTGMTRLVDGFFLAGQINGTSGYEEAAAQGLIAGVNAARFVRAQGEFVLGRDEAYAGVLMDDLVTKTPTEPYRMFTSRAEHRLLLRADNAADRLTGRAVELGLLESCVLQEDAGRDGVDLGRLRRDHFARRRAEIDRLHAAIDAARVDHEPLSRIMRRQGFDAAALASHVDLAGASAASVRTVLADRLYDAYLERERASIRRAQEMERRRVPDWVDFALITSLRTEAREALMRFRPTTFGQAGRLEGVTPADLTLLAVWVKRGRPKDPAGV
ncbi:MAG: tRNA uridine-5-carboxymethylaminomethyl(34) synthesis enzyme MnmG [Phycisphaerales bacterium]|nr:MAG: tRNA uridine-5-carboxymethylaminomethyl(34) synthesis enzyme MnmG [Phycisphaerales bacterium]